LIATCAALATLVLTTPAAAKDWTKACDGVGVSIPQRIAACDRIIKANRGTPRDMAAAYNNRGGALYYSGQTERAIADYDRAIKLHPGFAHAHNNRCWAAAVLNRTEQAIADCTQVLKLHNIANTYENRAFAHLKRGDYDRAISDYNTGLALEPHNTADFLYGRGLAKMKKGDASGEADIAEAKKADPHIADNFAKYGLK
jgi:tetratricopeptide (TPR) repeat protein